MTGENSHKHLIGRERFEIEFYSQRSAHRLQSVISRLANDTLHRILDSELSRVLQDDEGFRFDQLVVDVGDIPYDRIEAEFPPRFEAALRRMLGESVEKARLGQLKGATRISEAGSILQALAAFLVNGDVPWWKSSTTGEPENWLDKLLKNKPSDLVRMLRREGKKRQVRKRLVYQFPLPMLERVVYALEPADAAFIIAYAYDLDTVHDRKPLVKESAGGFSRVKWEIIFAYLLADRGSIFNRREFLRGTIRGLAAHYNIAYHQLLKMLAEAATELSKQIGFRNSLPELLFDLYAESAEQEWRQNNSTDKKEGTENQSKKLVRDLDLLRYFLLHGSFPSQSAAPQKQGFPVWVLQLLNEAPSAVLLRLRAVSRFPNAISRYVSNVNEAVLQLTVEKAEPAHASVILSFTQTVRRVHDKEKLAAVPAAEFSKQIWTFVLNYLFTEHGSYFNARMFVFRNLRSIAAHYNLSYNEVLEIVHEAAASQKQQGVRSASLIRILTELGREEKEKTEAAETLEENKSTEEKITLRQSADALRYYFRHGTMPWWAKGMIDSSDVSQLMQRLIDENDAEMLKVLREAARDDSAFRRLEEKADDEITERFVLLAGKNETQSWVSWLKKLEEVLAQRFGKRKTEKIFRLFRTRLLHLQLGSSKDAMAWTSWLGELLSESAIRLGITVHEILFIATDSVALISASLRLPVMQTLRDFHQQAAEGLYREAGESFENAPEEYVLARSEAEDVLQQIAAKFPELFPTSDQWRLIQFLLDGKNSFVVFRNDEETEKWIKLFFASVSKFEQAEPHAWRLLRKFWLRYYHTKWRLFLQQHGSPETDEEETASASPQKEDSKDSEHRFIEKMITDQYDALPQVPPADHISPAFVELFELVSSASPAHVHFERMLELIRKLHSSHPDILLKKIREWSLVARWRKVLAQAFSDVLLAEILMRTRMVSPPLLRDVLRFFSTLSITPVAAGMPVIAVSANSYREFLLAADALLHRSAVRPEEWLRTLLLFFATELKTDPDLLVKSWSAAAQRYVSEWRSDLILLLQHLHDPNYLKRMRDRFLARIKQLEEEAEEERKTREALEKEEEKKESAAELEPASSWIHNAGLVLIWPYLTQLFRRLGYVKGNKFENESSALRAVMLLQYMCTKQDAAPEYELVLNKLLCGVKQTLPVPATFIVTDEEKTVCDDLIRAVLRSWPALKTTTPEGFRVSFLTRNGKISREDEKWTLRVEQKAYDKLLSMLPWSIGIIKLPWMDQPLYTEWKH